MSDYSLLSIIKVLHNRRKFIVYATAATAVLSAVISLVVPVYYESTTTFYAASEDLFKARMVFGYSDTEVNYYGGTDDIQRILTVATSRELTDYLVDKYDLYSNYNIDRESPRAAYRVREKLLNRYEVIRTKYDAIELVVEDTDPQLASDIANAARQKISDIISQVIRQSQSEVIESYRSSIAQKEDVVSQIFDTLNRYQVEYGIIDPESQAEILSTIVTSVENELVGAQAKLESYKRANRAAFRDSIVILEGTVAGLEKQLSVLMGRDTAATGLFSLERFNRGKGQISLLDDAFRKAVNTVNIEKELLKMLESGYNLSVPAIHVVEVAQPATVKSRPRRTLIVAASTLAAFLFISIGILFYESYSHHDWTFLKQW